MHAAAMSAADGGTRILMACASMFGLGIGAVSIARSSARRTSFGVARCERLVLLRPLLDGVPVAQTAAWFLRERERDQRFVQRANTLGHQGMEDGAMAPGMAALEEKKRLDGERQTFPDFFEEARRVPSSDSSQFPRGVSLLERASGVWS